MKNTFVKIAAALLLCVLCAGVCLSCSDPVTVPESTENTDGNTDSVPSPTDGMTEAETAAEPVMPTVAGVPLNEFSIIYSRSALIDEGELTYKRLRSMISEHFGFTMDSYEDFPVKEDPGPEIVVGKVLRRSRSSDITRSITDPYAYRLEEYQGNIYICGGSSFALRCAMEVLCRDYLDAGDFPAGTSADGSAFGEYLYPLTEGAELRIMSNNVWNCDATKAAWTAKGEDCSAKTRSTGIASVYMAYRPDVICFQEMTNMMIKLIREKLKDGYNYTLLNYASGSEQPYTCIMYNSEKLTLLEQGHHTFAYGSDSDSKGYTWGLFELKSNGKKVIVMSTHLWWKSESAQAGSNEYRNRQAAEIAEKCRQLSEQYGCSCFVLGDYNTSTSSDAFRTLLNSGFRDAYDMAELLKDDNRGYHSCSGDGFARETEIKPYKGNAIDHITVYDGGCGSRVLAFDHSRPYFYIKLSDHYPVYADIIIGNDR